MAGCHRLRIGVHELRRSRSWFRISDARGQAVGTSVSAAERLCSLAVRTRFLGQPFVEFGGWTASSFLTMLADDRFKRVRIASAWMKRSGLSRLQDGLAEFRRTGGTASALIGIDEGGATREGLELSLALFDTVWIYHEPGARTFHPKVYMLDGEETAALIVGSSNVTAGGLFSNFEASLLAELDLSLDDDRALFAMTDHWFDSMTADQPAARQLNDALLAELLQDPRYRVASEEWENRPATTGADAAGERFGKGPLDRAPFAPRSGNRPSAAATPSAPGSTINAIGGGTRARWWKKLPATDALRPPLPNSNPTGNLRLSQAGLDIDHRRYFREELFGSAAWAAGPRMTEVATIRFQVVTGLIQRGAFNIRVTHAPKREAAQNNVTTVLHWGLLADVLRERDYTGWWVLIERDDAGTFSLSLTASEPN